VIDSSRATTLKGPVPHRDRHRLRAPDRHLSRSRAEKGNALHRYLKPANIKVTPEGHGERSSHFGLAKASDERLSAISPPLCRRRSPWHDSCRLILGTAADNFLAEQARGKAVR